MEKSDKQRNKQNHEDRDNQTKKQTSREKTAGEENAKADTKSSKGNRQ